MKYLHFLRFACKEQMTYRANFIFSMFTMIGNDILFVMIYVIFLSFFTNAGLEIGDFLIAFSLVAFYYGVVYGLFANLGEVGTLIEQGKMDYYLSFPVHPLAFLAATKIDAINLGDIIFGIVVGGIYARMHQDIGIFGQRLILAILWSALYIGITLLCWSLSFLLDKGSEINTIIREIFLTFSGYPPPIFERHTIVFILMSLVGLFPFCILPYRLLSGDASGRRRAVLIGIDVGVFLLGIFAFTKWLKKYTSGNLIMQM